MSCSCFEGLGFTPQRQASRAASPSPPWASPVPRVGATLSLTTEQSGDVELDIAALRMGSRGKQALQMPAEMLEASGSLPEAKNAEVAGSANAERLANVPRALLRQQSKEGLRVRRDMLHGARIIFVSAGVPGKRFTLEKAASLGVRAVVLDQPDSWSRSLVEEGVVEHFLPVDMAQDPEQIFQQSLHLIRTLGKVDGVATFVELSVPLVARLAEALGLPGHSPAAVDTARNKHATRACMTANGLPAPRNFLITDASLLQAAIAKVGFPAVLKPVSGAGSLGVRKVTCEEEMQGCYQELQQELSSLVVSSGALIQACEGSGIQAECAVDLTVLMEQFLDGPEVDVDLVMSEGQYWYASVTDNGPTLEPYFQETWAVCPSLLPKEKQLALRDLAVASVLALGFTAGVFHVECKYTSSGPQLIEINARMGGMQVHECNLRTWGVSLVEETLLACLGIPSRPLAPKWPLAATGFYNVNSMRSGVVADLSGLDALQQRDGVVRARALTQLGCTAVGPEEGFPTWLYEILVQQRTPREVRDLLLMLAAEEPVKVKSGAAPLARTKSDQPKRLNC